MSDWVSEWMDGWMNDKVYLLRICKLLISVLCCMHRYPNFFSEFQHSACWLNVRVTLLFVYVSFHFVTFHLISTTTTTTTTTDVKLRNIASECLRDAFDCVRCGRTVRDINRVPTPPAKSWNFLLKIPHLESRGKSLCLLKYSVECWWLLPVDYTLNIVCFFFISRRSLTGNRSWKIVHGVLESPGFFVSKRVGTLISVCRVCECEF